MPESNCSSIFLSFLPVPLNPDMIHNTFCHIPHLSERAESRLWNAGYQTWDDLLSAPARIAPRVADAVLRETLEASIVALRRNDACWFSGLLPRHQEWRLFRDFQQRTAYIDIETTGYDATVTTIAVYDGRTVSSYVAGRNLYDFPRDIRAFDLLVSYNGKCFDIPVLEKFFCMSFPLAHLDLRFLLRRIGITGGLKRCEEHLAISRGALEGLDGYSAVVLWQEYSAHQDDRILETLLAYNTEDVLHLPLLMTHAYNTNLNLTPFYEKYFLPPPVPGVNPYRPDITIVERILARQRRYGGVTIDSLPEAYA
jgi:uncharacterized protein YprB with RNaseH-like and TPR domain